MIAIVTPSSRSRCQHVQYFVALVAPEACQRLVEQQQPRLAGERACQFHQPQLLVGELPGLPRRELQQADVAQCAVPPPP